MIVGRDLGDGVQLRRGDHRFGDDTSDTMYLSIEPAAKHGAFDIELLLTYSEVGPSDEWLRGERGRGIPTSRTITGSLALMRDERAAGEHADRTLARNALHQTGVLVMTFTDYETKRDAFGLARRACDDLARRINDTAP